MVWFMCGEGGSCEVMIEFIGNKMLILVFELGRVNIEECFEFGKI